MSTRLKRINTCAHCGKEYHPYAKEQRYCSIKCALPYRSAHRKRRVIKSCEVCDIQYEVQKCREHTARYCSKKCWSNRNPPNKKECQVCGKEYYTRHRNQFTCSNKCAGKRRSKIYIGENATAYKDGKSLKRDRARLAPQLKEWREAVYKRDNYMCQECGNDSKIHAHHIKSWSSHDNLRFDIDNGITLCIFCHGKLHGKDFANRRNKICPACGNITKGRSLTGKGLCHSCAANIWHLKQGHELNLSLDMVEILNRLIAEE